MKPTDRDVRFVPLRAVFGLFLCFFLLMSSGRLGSADAGAQLQATMLLATTGRLGTVQSPGGDSWVAGPGGRIYEAHDIGAVVAMFPSAFIAARSSSADADTLFRTPPLIAKAGASLTYAVISAFGCTYLFALFCNFYATKEALILTGLFIAGTFFLPYSKMAWDVLPAAAIMCAFLFYMHRTLLPGACLRHYAAAGIVLGILVSFRYSLLPFMAVSVAVIAWRKREAVKAWILFGTCTACVLMPTFAYNFVRTGSPLRPATASAIYLHGNNSLDGDLFEGFSGLIFSGNRGLIFHAPILMLMLFLPLIWGRLPLNQRVLTASMGAGALLYALLISKMVNWGAYGWGPRYLLPVLPIMFLYVAPVFAALKARFPRTTVTLLVIAVTLNVAPALTNWNIVVSEFPEADTQNTRYPSAIKGTWVGMWRGMHGQTLAFPEETAKAKAHDPTRRFPDLWTARLIELSGYGRVAGYLLVAALLTATFLCLRRIRCAVLDEQPSPWAVDHLRFCSDFAVLRDK